MVIDAHGNIFVLRGNQEVLWLRTDGTPVRHLPIDPALGARSLDLSGQDLWVQGMGAKSQAVGGVEPVLPPTMAGVQNGFPVAQELSRWPLKDRTVSSE